MKGEERMMGCSKLIDLAMTGSPGPSAIVNSHDHVDCMRSPSTLRLPYLCYLARTVNDFFKSNHQGDDILNNVATCIAWYSSGTTMRPNS